MKTALSKIRSSLTEPEGRLQAEGDRVDAFDHFHRIDAGLRQDAEDHGFDGLFRGDVLALFAFHSESTAFPTSRMRTILPSSFLMMIWL